MEETGTNSSSNSESPSYNFKETSIWLETPNDIQPRLEGEVKVDIAIVGGGYTGLNAALLLKEAGVDVAIIEQDYCGKGASGRNEGHLTPTIGKDLPSLVKIVGQKRAIEFARFADRAVKHTEAVFEKYQIDCDYKPVGNIVTGMHSSHREPLKKMADLAAGLGVGVSFLDEAEMSRRNLPDAFRFGVLEHCGGHLHPGKYVLGLRAAALKAGVRIYEGTSVSDVKNVAKGVEISCESGSVISEKAIIATNAYSPVTLKKVKSKVVPLRVTLFQTCELTPDERKAVGWDGEEGLYTAHEALESYRPSPDGKRIIGGSKYVSYGYNSSLVSGYQPQLFEKYVDLFKQRFPQVPELEIETFWGGWIGMTLDFLPLSYGDSQGNIYHGVGYNGHGVAQATLNGKILADQIQGIPNEDAELLKRRMIPILPEPIRWLGVNAMKWYFDRIDKKVDDDIRLGRD